MLATLLGLSTLTSVACAKAVQTVSILDADVRQVSDEGVVTEVTLDKIVIDNDRVYKVSPNVESFIATTKKVTALLSTDHRYIQIGVDRSNVVIWVSTVGVVAKIKPPVARYTGVFLRTDSQGRAVFKDQTVLKIKKGLVLPKANKQVSVIIDPVQHEIAEFLGT